ncbi:hypothetical protein NC653_041106 [Populus alba x Populus x berolinensis]|uniref:Uncharacterized protein n=1 Tax=Populus alba x Populus x berolinensis TaxID=444605 RepID=A0AAD6L7N3_9ROSI|nr:hypothetical protein NC653_041106 [Populus alba x Populus x berolinensis]
MGEILFRKQDREEGGEEEDPVDVSKAVGEAGKGLANLTQQSDNFEETLVVCIHVCSSKWSTGARKQKH